MYKMRNVLNGKQLNIIKLSAILATSTDCGFYAMLFCVVSFTYDYSLDTIFFLCALHRVLSIYLHAPFDLINMDWRFFLLLINISMVIRYRKL